MPLFERAQFTLAHRKSNPYQNARSRPSRLNPTLNRAVESELTRIWDRLGRSQYPGDPYLDGDIDEFRIYDRALSPDEVQALANGS